MSLFGNEDEDELEGLGMAWGRYTWTFVMIGLGVAIYVGWAYYPIPGYDRDVWWLLGTIGYAIVAVVYLGPFTWVLGAKRIQLGNVALQTLNEDAFRPRNIPWHDEHGRPIVTYTVRENGVERTEECLFKKGRTGGIPILGIKGKDWVVWADFPGANVDEGVIRRIRVDVTPYPLQDLPDAIRSDFVRGGQTWQRGYQPGRSRIFFGIRPLVDAPYPTVHARLDAALRAESRMTEKLESELRRIKGLGQKEPEGELVRLVRREEERKRELTE